MRAAEAYDRWRAWAGLVAAVVLTLAGLLLWLPLAIASGGAIPWSIFALFVVVAAAQGITSRYAFVRLRKRREHRDLFR